MDDFHCEFGRITSGLDESNIGVVFAVFQYGTTPLSTQQSK